MIHCHHMKPIQLILLTAIFLTAGPSAQNVPADSSAVAVKKAAPPLIKNTDGDLILDDNDNSILPVVSKKAGTPAAPPAAKVAADTVLKTPATNKVDTMPVKTAVPAGTAQFSTPRLGKNTTKKVTDEELILEGGEEDLLGKEKNLMTKAKAPAGGATPAAPLDSANVAAGKQNQGTLRLPGAVGSADSAAPSAPEASAPIAVVPSPAATIEDAHSINFARNLKEYRSPKLAMLMSLILPGSGQVYAKSNLWAAAFGVVEVALISTGAALSAKATRIKNQAHAFADQHYDTTKFRQYTTDLKRYLLTIPNVNPPKNADSLFKLIFVSGEDTTFFSDARKRNDNYYKYINGGTSTPSIRGWDDVEPTFSPTEGFLGDTSRFGFFSLSDTSYLLYLKPNRSNRMYGISANQAHYNGILNDSKHWADFSLNTFLSLVINHLASSVMAGIAAKRHNDELLGKESFWQHIDIEPQYVNTGSGTAPGYALQVAF